MKTEYFAVNSEKINNLCIAMFDMGIDLGDNSVTIKGSSVPMFIKNVAVKTKKDFLNIDKKYPNSITKAHFNGYYGGQELNVSFDITLGKIIYISEDGDGKEFINLLTQTANKEEEI